MLAIITTVLGAPAKTTSADLLQPVVRASKTCQGDNDFFELTGLCIKSKTEVCTGDDGTVGGRSDFCKEWDTDGAPYLSNACW